eukprot:9493435-Pyramimonas_sp.AAC.1
MRGFFFRGRRSRNASVRPRVRGIAFREGAATDALAVRNDRRAQAFSVATDEIGRYQSSCRF